MFSPPSTAISQPATKHRLNVSTITSIHFKHSTYASPSDTETSPFWNDEWSILKRCDTSVIPGTLKGVNIPTRDRQRQQREAKTPSRPLHPIFTSFYRTPEVVESSISPSGIQPPLVVPEFDKDEYDQEVLDLLNKHKPARPRPKMARSVVIPGGEGEVVCLGSNSSEGVHRDTDMSGGLSSDEERLVDRVGRGVGTTSQRKKVAKMDALEAIKMKRTRNRSTSTTGTPSLTTSARRSRILNDIQPAETISARNKGKQTKDDEDEYEGFGNEELLAALGDDFRPAPTRTSSRRKEHAVYEYDDLYPLMTNASGSGSGSGQSAEGAIPWSPSLPPQWRSHGKDSGAEGSTSAMQDVKPLFLQSLQYDDDVVDLTNEEEDPIDGGIIDLDKEDEPATAADDGEDYFGGDDSFDYFGGDDVFDTMDWEPSAPGPSKAVSAPTARGAGNATTIRDQDMDYGDHVPPLVMLWDLSPRRRRFFETHWLGGNTNQATGAAKQQMDDEDERPPAARSRGGGRGGSKAAWRGRGGWRKRGR